MSSTRGTPRPQSRPQPGKSQQAGAPRGQKGQSQKGGRPAPNRQGPPPKGKQNPKGLVRPAPKAKVRKARLLVGKVDPWSVLKMAFLLSVALGIVTVVAGVVLWTVMDLTGIFDEINALIAQVIGTEGSGTTIQELVTLGQVASMSTIIAVINVVLITLLSMLGAVLYNICSSLVGGVGVMLTDD